MLAVGGLREFLRSSSRRAGLPPEVAASSVRRRSERVAGPRRSSDPNTACGPAPFAAGPAPVFAGPARGASRLRVTWSPCSAHPEPTCDTVSRRRSRRGEPSCVSDIAGIGVPCDWSTIVEMILPTRQVLWASGPTGLGGPSEQEASQDSAPPGSGWVGSPLKLNLLR